MIRAWIRVAAAVDRRIGIRCPVLWAFSRTYRDSFRCDSRSDYHRAVRLEGR